MNMDPNTGFSAWNSIGFHGDSAATDPNTLIATLFPKIVIEPQFLQVTQNICSAASS